MFRITQDPSLGSDKLYLTEIIYNGSNVLIMCVVSIEQSLKAVLRKRLFFKPFVI